MQLAITREGPAVLKGAKLGHLVPLLTSASLEVPLPFGLKPTELVVKQD